MGRDQPESSSRVGKRVASIQGLQPGGRHFPAGVRKPPDPGATTTSLLSRCASIGLQPGGRHFPAGVRKPPVFKPGGRHFSAGVRKPPDLKHVNNR